MSQVTNVPGLVLIPDIPLFLIGCVLFAFAISCVIWLMLREKDFRQAQREFAQEMAESYDHLSTYVQISAQGLLSDKWERMCDASLAYTCILCGRNYVEFPYQIYRDNTHPGHTILFASHVCPAIQDMTPAMAQAIAGAYEDDLQRFMQRFRLGEHETVAIPALAGSLEELPPEEAFEQAITQKRQRATLAPHGGVVA